MAMIMAQWFLPLRGSNQLTGMAFPALKKRGGGQRVRVLQVSMDSGWGAIGSLVTGDVRKLLI
jgi:hypothetical protein